MCHLAVIAIGSLAAAPPPPTVVSISGTTWHINGKPTHAGSEAEGLLPNARMIQGIFDDANASTRHIWAYPDTKRWDPDRNTREFVGNMSSWKEAGMLAFTVGLQGGGPDCYGTPDGTTASAYDAKTGALDPKWAARLLLILQEADRLGMVAIVQYFYNTQYVKMSAAAQSGAVTQITQWLLHTGLRNFVIDAFNERCGSAGEDAARLRAIRAMAPHFLLSSSCPGGDRLPDPDVLAASDFVLLHGNGDSPLGIAKKLETVRSMAGWSSKPRPIVFNEDDHGNLTSTSATGSNLQAALDNRASWGFLCCCTRKVQGDYSTGFQCPPVDWRINGGGQCLSGPQGKLMTHGSKSDWGETLRRISKPKL